jgi:hypothetical protein
MSKLEPTRTYSNPTATDELCRMLDEQGLEWREHEAPATDCIAFFDGDGWHDCWESVDGEVNVTFSMTPEQAIAATLGTTDANPTQAESSGTCHVESSIIDTYEYNRWEYELSCGHTIIWEDSEPPRYCPNCGRRIEQ